MPPSVQEAVGELLSAANGLLAMSVGVGPGVLSEMMEAEVDEVVGPKFKRNPGRSSVRHGHEGVRATARALQRLQRTAVAGAASLRQERRIQALARSNTPI